MTELSAYELVVNVPYALVMVWVTLEVGWLAAQRRSLAHVPTALAMGAGAFVVGVLYTGVLRAVWGVVGDAAPARLVALWDTRPVVAAVVAFVAWDAIGWLYHWFGHASRLGWAVHQPHHSGEQFDVTLGLRQTWLPLHALALHPLLALAGFDFRLVAACAALSNCWQVLEHTSLAVRPPHWFSAVVMTPEAHRHHHASVGRPGNLGPVLTVWDRLMGTWVPSHSEAPITYGLGTKSHNPVTIELAGWRDLLTGRKPNSPHLAHVARMRQVAAGEAGD